MYTRLLPRRCLLWTIFLCNWIPFNLLPKKRKGKSYHKYRCPTNWAPTKVPLTLSTGPTLRCAVIPKFYPSSQQSRPTLRAQNFQNRVGYHTRCPRYQTLGCETYTSPASAPLAATAAASPGSQSRDLNTFRTPHRTIRYCDVLAHQILWRTRTVTKSYSVIES
jgi:hypothetical protein